MPMTRRALLGALALGLSGCAGSPVVSGSPTAPATQPKPSPQDSPGATAAPPKPSDEVAAAATAVAHLGAVVAAAGALPAWPDQPWSVAARAQCDAHLAVLTLPDPLSPAPQERFPLPSAPAVTTTAATLDADLRAAVDAAAAALERAAAAASAPETRLLYASAATASTGLLNRATAPVPGAARPRPLQSTTLAASLPIALGHAWALIYGLGVGLGRLPSKDPLHAWGTARLARARELRNELRRHLGTAAPEQPAAFELPTAMDSPASIAAGWAALEANLLAGYARLVAADPGPRWRALMRAQVPPTQTVGGAIPHWPGWVS